MKFASGLNSSDTCAVSLSSDVVDGVNSGFVGLEFKSRFAVDSTRDSISFFISESRTVSTISKPLDELLDDSDSEISTTETELWAFVSAADGGTRLFLA